MRFAYQIFLFIIISACNKKDQTGGVVSFGWNDFQTLEIPSKKYFFEEVVNPASIGLHEQTILLAEAWRVPEVYPRIHLINLKNWTYDRPKGKHGRGPNEITDATQFLNSFNPNSFWIYNMNGRKLVEFSRNDSSLLGIKEWKLPEQMAFIRFIEKASDSTFLATPWDGDKIILEFNREGNLINEYGNWEAIKERPDLNLKEVSEINVGWFNGNPAIGLFIHASLYRDVLKFFNYRKKELLTFYGPNIELPLFDLHKTSGPSVFFKPTTTYRYRDIAITTNYVFALYGGYSQVEFNQTGIIAKDIFVFDHNGKPLWNLKLDRSIIEMVINEKTNEIYGLTTDENPGIAVFEIPDEILKN